MLRKSLLALLAITSATTLTVITLAQSSSQLTVALANDPKSLFLPRAADRSASNAAWSLYNGLVWTNEDGDIVPALATKWDVSSDGKTYTFTLRQGVTFHNGEVFDSESVVATWETGLDKSNDYADTYKRVKEVKALDKYTVRMMLEGSQDNATQVAQCACSRPARSRQESGDCSSMTSASSTESV